MTAPIRTLDEFQALVRERARARHAGDDAFDHLERLTATAWDVAHALLHDAARPDGALDARAVGVALGALIWDATAVLDALGLSLQTALVFAPEAPAARDPA